MSETISQPNEPNEELRQAKLGLLEVFLNEVKEKRMSEDEFLPNLEIVVTRRFITGQDEKEIRHKLDVILGRTPEQIRENKLGLLRLFAKLVVKKQMDEEEFAEHVRVIIGHGYITEDDLRQIKLELDQALGRTPEQVRERALGICKLFIEQYRQGRMEEDEVKERIVQMVGNGSISAAEGNEYVQLLRQTVVEPS